MKARNNLVVCLGQYCHTPLACVFPAVDLVVAELDNGLELFGVVRESAESRTVAVVAAWAVMTVAWVIASHVVRGETGVVPTLVVASTFSTF